MTYTIANNTQFNSTEITFDGKPSEKVRTVLKEMHYRWHSVKKVWYGYKDEETIRKAIDNAENGKAQETQNECGVKVGDIFSASWGYEQTNVDFFQVIALVGKHSVRVREVHPRMIEENPTCGMAADRTYKMTNELLPPATSSVFIKDQEHGDLKRIKAGYHKDPEIAKANCYFTLSSFASAYKCNGETVTEYESWYA